MASLIAGLSSCVLMFLSDVSGLGSGGIDGTMKLGVYVGGFAAHGVPLMVSISCWSYLYGMTCRLMVLALMTLPPMPM